MCPRSVIQKIFLNYKYAEWKNQNLCMFCRIHIIERVETKHWTDSYGIIPWPFVLLCDYLWSDFLSIIDNVCVSEEIQNAQVQAVTAGKKHCHSDL